MKQIKEIMKKVLVVFMIICALLPTLFSGIVFADDNNNLTTERAGNFAANFAINFYDNWSSVSTVETDSNGKSNSGSKLNSSGEYSKPLENMVVNSEYAKMRDNGPHLGTDLDASVGTPIYASHGGTVTFDIWP